MRIKVLGCSGAEFAGHRPPGFLLDGKISFDAGSLTNVLSAKAQLKIRTIFITHAHLDHIRSIPFLADNIMIRGGKQRITIMTIAPVIKTIKRDLFNSSMWPDFTGIPNALDPVLKLVAVKEGRTVALDDYRVTPYRVNHSVPATGYLIEDASDKRVFYTGDTGPTTETWKKVGERLIHCLIIEVSFPNKMSDMAAEMGHLTSRLLRAELAKLSRMPERVYVTHPKPQFLKVIKKELQGLRMKNLFLLRDGDTIRV